jgi:hypothetical protein
MKTKVLTPLQIVERLRFVERLTADDWPIADAVRTAGMTEKDYARWRTEYGGLARTLGPGSNATPARAKKGRRGAAKGPKEPPGQ